jgi:hypothetical protein
MRRMPVLLSLLLTTTLPSTLKGDDAVDGSRQVIERQIEAFLKDDAGAAYAFAAPGIKARYPDKDIFFDMVKKSYQPVYKPGNFAFGRSLSLDGGATVLHEVLIEGRDGKDWKALYKLQRQPDGSYRIGGVTMVPELESKGI